MISKGVLLLTGLLMNASIPCHGFSIAPDLDRSILQAMTDLYNVDFARAEGEFQQTIAKFPAEPLPHLFHAAYLWWRAAEQFENPKAREPFREMFEKEIQETVDTSRAKADRLGREDDEICFSLGGAYGLAGRWLVIDGHWIKAYNYGKKGQAYLKKALQLNPELYDAYLGLGIYDYYTDTMSGFFKRLAASIFIHGDKERGLEELRKASLQSHFATVEAKLFLINAYEKDEHDYRKALDLIVELRKSYPDSPLFHYTEIFLRFDAGDQQGCVQEALSFVDKIHRHVGTYEIKQLPLASLFLGNVQMEQRNFEGAVRTLTDAITAAPDAPPAWLIFCYLRRGQAEDLLEQRPQAIQDYRMVLALPDFRNSQKKAKRHLRKPCTFEQALKSMKD